MDPQTFMDIATMVTKLKMYPYFDIAHYILMCIALREDIPSASSSTSGPASASGSQIFSRKHPFSCWLSCMLTCFAGSIIANLILGEPCITPFKNHRDILTATAVWYLIFYSPFDLVYKFVKFTPIKLVFAVLKEVNRSHKVYHGVYHTAKLYPNSYLVILMIGTIKGCGSNVMRNFERLVRGLWVPASNEILQPSFVTKASVLAAGIFVLERHSFIVAPHAIIYFGVVIFFLYFKLSSILLGIHDPFAPFENLFCAVFLGGMWDAMKRAVAKEPKKEEDSKEMKNDILTKSKEEKKKD